MLTVIDKLKQIQLNLASEEEEEEEDLLSSYEEDFEDLEE